jgi:Domain of unknown function (DUF4352)
MTTRRRITRLRGTAALALILIGGLVSTACNSGGSAAAPVTREDTPVARVPAPSAHIGATAAPGASNGGTKAGSLDCQALADAAFDLNTSEPVLVMLTGPGGGSAVNSLDSPMYVDTAKLRADLNVLAALPDPTDATEISIMGKPSEAIPQFRQLLDIIDKDANANPTPGSTPSTNGAASDQQLLDFGGKFIKMSTAINSAVGNACPGVSAKAADPITKPGSQATPLAASYQIGHTAPVGTLRVTLDKVVTLPGADALLPSPGNRFVFAYFTVENTGKNASQLNMMTGTHWEDATGKQYFFDPDTIMLDPNTTNFDGGIEPGAKQSGAVGYLLPIDGADMVWVFEDFKPNRVVFAVKASDIASAGTPVTEPTEDAMRAQAAATQTAFVEMALDAVSADATQEAAGTETPAPPGPTDTVAPSEPTTTSDTPAADTPLVEPTDTAPVSP